MLLADLFVPKSSLRLLVMNEEVSGMLWLGFSWGGIPGSNICVSEQTKAVIV